jgi:hypothetical protein
MKPSGDAGAISPGESGHRSRMRTPSSSMTGSPPALPSRRHSGRSGGSSPNDSSSAPVGPPDTIERLRPEVDEVGCLATPRWFTATGSFYRDFRQLSDEDVIRLLAEAPRPARVGT